MIGKAPKMHPGRSGESATDMAVPASAPPHLLEAIRLYWNAQLHDLAIAQSGCTPHWGICRPWSLRRRMAGHQSEA
jgi:hypothetical protein